MWAVACNKSNGASLERDVAVDKDVDGALGGNGEHAVSVAEVVCEEEDIDGSRSRQRYKVVDVDDDARASRGRLASEWCC